MKGSQLRFSLLLGVFVAMGCTQLKATGVVTAAVSPTGASPSPEGLESPAVFPSPSPTAEPPSPTPEPLPSILLIEPTVKTDFASDKVDISFTAAATAGEKVVSATVSYNGQVIGSFSGEGPTFKVEDWNPNVVNSKAEVPDTAPVASGDKTLSISVTDSGEKTSKLEFSFRKPLKITGWTEVAQMPGPTSHFGAFGDGAQPPAFMTLWGSIDGFETTVFPRNQVYGFSPTGNGAWTTVKINGSSVPRAGYGAAMHPTGQLVYLVGGRTGTQDLRTMDVFSPLRKVAEQSLTSMTDARRDPAVVYADKFLYAIGGKSGENPIYSVERVEIGEDGNAKGDWAARGDTLNARAGANAALVGKEIWLFGGGFRPIEAYDLATNTWRFLTGPDGNVVGAPEAWANALMVPVGDRLYFFGGSKEDGQPIERIYEFTPVTKAWRDVGALPKLEAVPAPEQADTRMAGFFLDGNFYLVGGQSLPEKLVTSRVYRGATL